MSVEKLANLKPVKVLYNDYLAIFGLILSDETEVTAGSNKTT